MEKQLSESAPFFFYRLCVRTFELMQVLHSFFSLLLSSSSGLTLKLVSLVSKFLLLLLVVPVLTEGDFSSYLIDLTIAAILSKILSLGAADRIPLLSPRYTRVARNQLVFISISVLLSSLLVFSFSDRYLSLGGLVLALVGSSFISGFIRVKSPLLFEITQNLPPIVFFLVVYADADFRLDLVATYALCFSVSSSVALCIAFFNVDAEKVDPEKGDQGVGSVLRSLFAGVSLQFSFSAISQMLFLRSPVLVAEVLGKTSDTIAVSVSLGEIAYQLLIVISNRLYSNYFRKGEATNVVSVIVLYLFSALALLVFPLYAFSGLSFAFLTGVDDWFVQSFVFFVINMVLWINVRNILRVLNRQPLVFKFEIVLLIFTYSVSFLFFNHYLLIAGAFFAVCSLGLCSRLHFHQKS